MASPTEICNLAIGHLGSGKEIASLDEKSAEARACNRFFEQCRKQVQRDFTWPFSTKFVALALVSNPPTETDEWQYSYRYPSDCLFFRKIPSGNRNDFRASRVPYRIGQDAQGTLIYCDIDSAKGEYSVDVDDTNRWPVDAVTALSLLLAGFIAPSITAGDPFKMGARALQMYQAMVAKAQDNAFNEEQVDPENDSEFIAGRN